MATESTRAAPANLRVNGKRSRINSLPERRLVKDSPKSKLVNSRFMNTPYWTMNGLSKPILRLISSMVSSDATSIIPCNRKSAGSPVT